MDVLESLGSLRFFFGGFGDARHLFTTLIDLHAQVLSLLKEKQSQLNVVFVLNDIKPHAVAKLLIMLAALRKFSQYDAKQIGNFVEATKSAALVNYLFIANIMPAYFEKETNN